MEATEIFHIPPARIHAQPPPLSASSPQWYTVTTAEPALTQRYHPESVVYIKVRSWCCAVCGFRQMCNDVYPSVWCHTEWFHCPKDPLCSTYLSRSPPQPLAITDFLLLHSFAFSRRSISFESVKQSNMGEDHFHLLCCPVFGPRTHFFLSFIYKF